MSWLRGSPFPFGRQLSRALDPRTDYEPGVCFQSFSKHWQQARDIILNSGNSSLHDGVLGVVNHLEQMATLLQLEARARELRGPPASPPACLEHLLAEGLLDKVYEWGKNTGRYVNAVRLEQLKLYSALVSGYSGQLVAAEPFLRPLLKLLTACAEELLPTHVEGQLVTVLSQLCVVLMQNTRLVDLFFVNTDLQNGQQAEFIIVRLLLSCVHREGAGGAIARDGLLLCSKMTAANEQLCRYMLDSNVCVVLATGLSGLYSLLPRTLGDFISERHRLTPDDVIQVDKLPLFINSLEFCNAVAQVAHPSIKRHLLDFFYQGFLIPVMGPALLQSGVSEQVAAVAYLELALRCASGAGLLRSMLRFLCVYAYDGIRVMDVLLARLDRDTQLSMVTLALMETLVDLNCEDVMLALVYKFLLNGEHLMVSHRARMCDAEPYREAAVAFLTLSPECCFRPLSGTRDWAEAQSANGKRASTDGRTEGRVRRESGDIPMSSLQQEFNYGNSNETLIGNYHSYLCDARHEIATRTLACSKWSSKYDGTGKSSEQPTILGVVNEFRHEHENMRRNDTKSPINETDNFSSYEKKCDGNSEDRSDGNGEIKSDEISYIKSDGISKIKSDVNSDSCGKEHDSLTCLSDLNEDKQNSDSSGKEPDSLTSLGESSGYDSFRYRLDDQDEQEETLCEYAEESFWKKTRTEVCGDFTLSKDRRGSGDVSVGPFLSVLMRNASTLLDSDVRTTVLVTGLISKLATFPTTLSASLLLCGGLVLQPSVPSLFQIISKLKREVDEVTRSSGDVSSLVDEARMYLVRRELTYAACRHDTRNQETTSFTSTEVMENETSPLRRSEPKRRSISTSLTSMFARKLNSISNNDAPQHTPITPPQVNFTHPSYWSQSVTRRSVLNAVIIDEWLKELSAIAHEHSLLLAMDSTDDIVRDTLCL